MREIRTKTGIIFTLLVCTALVLSGCGSKTTESAGDEVSGRVSAFSDSEITVEVFRRNSDNSDGRPKRPDAASGGAVSNGEQPPGNPSESMKWDGEAPNGKNGNETENDNQSSK